MPRKKRKSMNQRRKYYYRKPLKPNADIDRKEVITEILSEHNEMQPDGAEWIISIDSDEFSDTSAISTEDEFEDSDGFRASEFYVILDKVYKYDPKCDLDAFVRDKQFRMFQILKDQVSRTSFSNFCVVSDASTTIQLVQFYHSEHPTIKLSVSIDKSFCASINVHRKLIDSNHDIWLGLPKFFNTVNDIEKLLAKINAWTICHGNNDEDFKDFLPVGSAITHAKSMHTIHAYREGDFGAEFKSTIRSDQCNLLISGGVRCPHCIKYRGTLRKMKSRQKCKQDASPPSGTCTDRSKAISSHKPNTYMSKSELITKVGHLKSYSRNLEIKTETMKRKLAKEIELQGAKFTSWDSEEISTLVSDTTSEVEKAFPDPNSVQRLFWDQQIKYNKLKSKSAMTWHPMIIKLCLHLRSKSNKAYEALRDSGFVALPSSRTLFDYSNYTSNKLGFQADVMDMLIDEVNKKKMHDQPWKGYVGLLQDEVKIKSDLVYDKHSGELVGFINLDSIGNQFLKLEQKSEGDDKVDQNLAKYLLVLMVRGIAVNLVFPLAAFATAGITASFLYSVLWQAILLIETHVNLKVLFVTCDGASQNRKFFDMHRIHEDDNFTYFTTNLASEDNRKLFFISDVPHLVKTTRNCFSNSYSHKKTRNLWNAGKDISWLHIVKLYEDHCENNIWSVCPKLTRNHIDLTAYSIMKVNLATQVLSNSVALALEYHYPQCSPVTETAKFIRLMDNFFD